MNIVFTICSNNYLSQAKTLGDSVLKHNPDYKFIIGVVDRKSETIDYSKFDKFELIHVEELAIDGFEKMVSMYNIVELNTSVKPFYIEYLFKNRSCNWVSYIDPDIMCFSDFKVLEEYQGNYDILLTPHILTPIKIDNTHPQEKHFLRFGIYNFGFVSVKNVTTTAEYLNWWKTQMSVQCFNSPKLGLFVDQLPNNFTPIFFKNVGVVLDPGYNMAHWNLHERVLTNRGVDFIVNDQLPLVFYHFSRYELNQYEVISKFNTKYFFNTRPDLVEIHKQYSEAMISNDFYELKKEKCYFITNKKQENQPKKKGSFARRLYSFLKKELNG